jgi:hypothetical protein
MHDSTLVVLLGSILVLPGSGTCQPCLRISHRPDGKIADTHALTFCSLFAGRRCLCPGWHSGHLMVHLQWEHSQRWRSARSCSKVPIALMVEDSHFARCLQGGVFVYGATVTIDSCTISRNNACCVRAAETCNCPNARRFVDALASTLAWQLWPTLRSTTVCTCHRDLEYYHRLDGKTADALASILACKIAADALRLTTVGTCRRDLKFSHRPHGMHC